MTASIPAIPQADRRLGGDDGFVLAITALIMVSLLAFVSLGVDLGAWYARAEQIQRAADAAALAAAPLTPDNARASAAALDTLRKNHIDCRQFGGPIVCELAPVPNSEVTYRVTVTDPSVPQFFSRTFRGDVSVTRSASAERLQPIPMGSPTNYLGTNQLLTAPERENFFLAVSGKCASKEQGDRRMTVSDANWTALWPNGSYRACTGAPTIANPEFDATGYTYVMQLRQAFAGSVHLEVYDPTLCDSGVGNEDPDAYGGVAFQFTYSVKGPANSPVGAPSVATWSPGAGSCGTHLGRWVTVHRFSNPVAGQYYLQIADTSPASRDTNRASNQFAIRARYDGAVTNAGDVAPNTWTRCSSIGGSTTPAYRADCPQVHGYKDMGVYAGVQGGTAEFYLADVGPDYGGRTMEVTLWDPGEGAGTISLINPSGAAVPVDWESTDCGQAGVADPTGGCSGRTTAANPAVAVSGDGTQPGAGRLSPSKYNDRPIRLSYKLPPDVRAAYLGKTWWKIRYTASGTQTVNDRTTWSVQIPGDPVRLVPSIG